MVTTSAAAETGCAVDFEDTLELSQAHLDQMYEWLTELEARIGLSHRLLNESRATLRWASTTARISSRYD